VAVDFRLVCATHRNLATAIEQGSFREDLYYRLNGLTLQLPPLCERQDLAALTARMMQDLLPDREICLAPELQRAFATYRWPGNLRQLQNALRTACALVDDSDAQIGWAHLPDDLVAALRCPAPAVKAGADSVGLRAQAERSVRQAVHDCAGNLSEAARRLGISRNTLYRKMDELGLRQR
jgi:transcriptional regulator of acetoin/glycerol metabolism